MSANTKVF